MGLQKLSAYQKGSDLAMKGFYISKSFPKEEAYSLPDQIQRSSRSVCTTISESYLKRGYEQYFVNKLTDADAENSETLVWLQFALAWDSISKAQNEPLIKQSEEVGKLTQYMIDNPGKFGAR